MGIASRRATFPDTAPSFATIADKVSELSALPVILTESQIEEPDDGYCSASLAYRSMPESKVELSRHIEAPSDGNSHTQPEQQQTLEVRIYLAQEPTLFYKTLLALEALGGKIQPPLSEQERQEYVKVFTSRQIEREALKLVLLMMLYVIGFLLLLPILIPFWIIQGIYSYIWWKITLPKILRQAEAQRDKEI
jgi:hypothetical protein